MVANWCNLSEIQFNHKYQNVEVLSLIIPLQETYPGEMWNVDKALRTNVFIKMF